MKANILCVDDEPDLEVLVNQKFRKQIRSQKYQFIFVSSGEQALSQLQDHPEIDIVLSDINMPGMDGLTLLSKISEINSVVKTIIISAYGELEKIRKAMNNGAFDFLTKPIDFQDLEITINKTLYNVEQIKENRRLFQQQEKQLRQQALAFANIYDGIIITDLEGRIVDWNPAAERMFGYSKEEALGQISLFFQNPEYAANLNCEILNNISHDSFWFGEIQFIRKDKTQGVCETIFVPLYNELGESFASIGVNHDITYRKQAEAEINKALTQEKELNELKSRFFYLVSHEFRTPLSTIFASSKLLQSYGHKLSEDQKQQLLDRIPKSVKKINNLIDDILLIGKTEVGKVKFNPASINLAAFCQDIIAEIELTDLQNHIFIFECQGEASSVEVDEILLRHILDNLLSNAVKYSPPKTTIQFNLICENDQIIFKIKDEGIGIPLSEQEHIFEIFHRASNVGNISGTGLGMAIVKNAVNLHGGTITFESNVNQGTTFTVSINLNLR